MDDGVRIIFLDIDGVVCPLRSPSWPKRCLDSLIYILQHTQARVVLSSTWRLNPETYQAVNEVLLQNGFQECMSCTPQLGQEILRPQEILKWLEEYKGHVISWVAIDDFPLTLDDNFKARFEGHFVLCKSTVGLNMELAIQAVKILGKPKKNKQKN